MSINPSISPASLRAHREELAAPSLATLDPLGRAAAVQGVGKRLIDLVGAGLGLALLSPLMLVISVLIRSSSGGSAIFRQTRLGKGGTTFQIYKFRTMVADAEVRVGELEHLNESEGGVLFKIKADPRVTSIGRILRRTSLDELPQLYNVLRGEMSLVGPRPLQLRDCQRLTEADPEAAARRLQVRPGLTGPWQIDGRSETGFAHMLRLDLDYVEHWSLWRDLLILVRTVVGMAAGRGAY